MRNLTPKEIVAELDKYIVGQDDAKRAVAVAVRNRWRRQQLGEQMKKDVSPKNILMIGPTGVGKTEIARRLATLTGAPFIKVEATKYTEIGYHGRDVDAMIRDLLDSAIAMVRGEMTDSVKGPADQQVQERLLDYLLPRGDIGGDDEEAEKKRQRTRDKTAPAVGIGRDGRPAGGNHSGGPADGGGDVRAGGDGDGCRAAEHGGEDAAGEARDAADDGG